MASSHECIWLDQSFIFPDAPGVYERDEPYLVQYCECGERRITDTGVESPEDLLPGEDGEVLTNTGEGGE